MGLNLALPWLCMWIAQHVVLVMSAMRTNFSHYMGTATMIITFFWRIVMSERTRLNMLYDTLVNPADMQRMALGDLFYLLTRVMGRPDLDKDFLFARCLEVQANPDGYLDLWAREHYKSTIITVGLTIQGILANPELTVGIFSHTRPIAKSFLRQIKREFENNKLLQELFPHILPPQKGEKRTWSEDDGLIVRRRGNPKEATLEAWGLVDGQPTGKHFALLIYDDVVTLESVNNPDMIKKTTDAWRISLNLGTQDGSRRMIGTRYHASDTYAEILKQGSVKARLYPATADGAYDGAPVLLSKTKLAEKRRDMGPYVFACQMLQNPLADKAQGFAVEWFRTYVPQGETPMNKYLVVDPASSKKQGSDYTSMWVIGLNHDAAYYVLDGVHDRLNLAERTRLLFDLHRRHSPHTVGYEKYGMQADVEHIREKMESENYRFNLVELGGQMPKNDRIRRLVPIFEQGRMWFPSQLPKMRYDGTTCDLTAEFYNQEYITFPVSSHDDMFDCLSRIVGPDLRAAFPMQRVLAAPQQAMQVCSIWD
jgi:phage terminase large subunit-like protein